MERTIVNAVASATETLQTSATELRDGANAARDATVEEWRSKTLTAITKVMEERVKIDAAEAQHTAFQTGSAIVAVLLFMITIICYATFYTVHRTIWNDGYKTGLTAAALHHDQQKVRASWANTHDGKLAYQLYQARSIPKLANCTAPGWKIGKSSTVCLSYMKGKAVYGWAFGP